MPVVACTKDGKPGFRAAALSVCPGCKCFVYDSNSKASRARARMRAANQLQAIKASQAQRGKK